VHQRDEVAVPEERAQLPGDVSVVDVDRNRADLEGRQHALDVLGPVEEVDADMIAGHDAGGQQVVSETVGPRVELRV